VKKRKRPIPSREELLGREFIERNERLDRAILARLERHAKELEERRRAQQS